MDEDELKERVKELYDAEYHSAYMGKMRNKVFTSMKVSYPGEYSEKKIRLAAISLAQLHSSTFETVRSKCFVYFSHMKDYSMYVGTR